MLWPPTSLTLIEEYQGQITGFAFSLALEQAKRGDPVFPIMQISA